MYNQVSFYTVDENCENQRIDNFLTKELKGVPKSHIYKIIRQGEVRVNKKRIDNTYKLQVNDIIRIPPINIAQKPEHQSIKTDKKIKILYEDDYILAVYKPNGMAVHGGSGVSFGIIEYFRSQEKYKDCFLELVHRLDKETSGVLLLAKKRSALTNLHEQIRDGKCLKKYYAIVIGHWQNHKQNLTFPLKKVILATGERKVFVDEQGQLSHTIIYLEKHVEIGNIHCSLLEAELKTGRTHQIRVHLAHAGFPILGDEKYGNFTLNKQLPNKEYRMYLHAHLFAFRHPNTGDIVEIKAEIDWGG